MTATAVAEPPVVLRPPREHIAELDGIRALAIWGVLISHLVFAIPAQTGGYGFLPRPVIAVFGSAWLGVDLFFVLSGFLITGVLLRAKERERPTFFRRFYLRRSVRIWPLYYCVLAGLWLTYGTHFRSYFALCAVFLTNLAPSTWSVPDAAGPLWSLAVEEQFYVLWPCFVLWLGRRRLRDAALAVVAIECVLRLFGRPGEIELTWFRADGLAMGAYVATWYAGWDGDRRRALRLAGGLCAVAAALAISAAISGRIRPGLHLSTTISEAICLFGALVTVAVAYRDHPLLRPLRWRFSGLTASLSYAMYLIHMPIARAWQAAFADAGWFVALSPAMRTLTRASAVVAACYGIALLTRRYIEAPALAFGARMTRRLAARRERRPAL